MYQVTPGVHKLTSRTSVGVLDWSCCSLALLPALTPVSCRYGWPCCRLVASTRSICSWHALKQSWEQKRVRSCYAYTHFNYIFLLTITFLLIDWLNRLIHLYTTLRNMACLAHLTCKLFNSFGHIRGIPAGNYVSAGWWSCLHHDQNNGYQHTPILTMGTEMLWHETWACLGYEHMGGGFEETRKEGVGGPKRAL